jgi:hypothetical protein
MCRLMLHYNVNVCGSSSLKTTAQQVRKKHARTGLGGAGRMQVLLVSEELQGD